MKTREVSPSRLMPVVTALVTLMSVPVLSLAQASSTAQTTQATLVAKAGDPRTKIPPQPVVLTIEGGGSLGVYEAGMTWAFVRLFKQQDSSDATKGKPQLSP